MVSAVAQGALSVFGEFARQTPEIFRRPGMRRAALRLLSIERADEIYPVLVEEIVALGFPRALVAAVDFETSEIRPVAALNCSKGYEQRFTVSLYAADDPIVAALHGARPATLPPIEKHSHRLYVHPILFHNQLRCWEAERDGRSDCLASMNARQPRKLNLQEQVCAACDMRAYAAVVATDLPKSVGKPVMAELAGLIELANRYLVRLFKVQHYFNRMRDMELTIKRMSTVMQSMADPVIFTDSKYEVLMQNRAAENFFKLPTPPGQEGLKISEGAIHAVEINNLLFSAALSSMAVSGADTPRDLTLVDILEGEEKLFEAISARVPVQENVDGGMVTVLRDVTDLRRADQELRDSVRKLRASEEIIRQDRDRLNLIIENVGDPIVVCDNTAKIVLMDSLAQELFGSLKEEARGADHVRNQAKFAAYISGFSFSYQRTTTGQLRLRNVRSGQEVEYDARSGKILDERGQTAFTVTVLRDLTAIRKLEQLRMERQILEIEKFAAMGRMAGTIAHEVNNPLEAIKNAIRLLDGHVTEKRKEAYDILKEETARVVRIVRQMLGLYRTGETAGTFDPNAAIEDTLLLFQRQLDNAGVRIAKHLGKLPQIVGSNDQFRQVMTNLVVNARDAMPRGGRLIIRTRHLSSPSDIHGVVRIVVADSGFGIPGSMLESIFEPFVTTKGEKGTGLGLWIVRGIIQNHAGKLRVRSREGKGTVFKIDLPVVR